MFRRTLFPLALAALTLATPALSHASRKADTGPAYNCAGYICIDADTGKVLAQQNADTPNPPASVTKLMTLLVVLDDVKTGAIKLSDTVTTDKEAYKFLGTKAYLTVGEKHTYDQMLYALMVQSANDGAMAVAKQDANSVDAFVAKMNARATQLGLTGTHYTSPHGYPPGRSGREPDMTTARDMSKLAREILKNKDALRYTSTETYHFRDGTAASTYLDNFTNHNKLLRSFSGCDGLKTGWSGDGSSIVTTASRGGKRVIVAVLGGKVPSAEGPPVAKTSQEGTRRLAAKLMEDGLAALGVAGAPPTGYASHSPATGAPRTGPAPAPVDEDSEAAAPAPVATRAATPAPAGNITRNRDGSLSLFQ